jgi:hypothetical protein
MGLVTSDIVIKAPGNFSLDERTGGDPCHGYESKSLISTAVDDMSLEVWFNPDEEVDDTSFYIQLSDHHVEDPETGRVFHANLKISPNREETEALIAFLQFCLDRQ